MGQVFQSLGELGAYLSGGTTPIYVVDPGLPLGSDAAIDGLWASQPSLRKVVDFVASNIAGIPIHLYERVSDTDRRRITDDPLARALIQPTPAIPGQPGAITAFRFWHSIVVDWLLRDRWAARKVQQEGNIYLVRIPARRFRLKIDGLERVTAIVIHDDRGKEKEEDPAGFVWDAGYTDWGRKGKYAYPGAGTSPMQTIAQILAEYDEAVAYRRSVWKNGARIPAVIERPGTWSSDEARNRFEASWKSFMKAGGREGGTPVLEDGMKLATIDAFKPQDTGDLEGRRLTDQEVASFYHIAPELVGARQGNYANMDAFRQGLYRESLGPYIDQLGQVVNLHLVSDFAGGRPLYAEHLLEAKLAGSFQEQAQILQTATGAPWMTRAEARSRLNLPKVPGADQLVIPLNVLIGGQASPRDSGSQNLSADHPLTKSQAPEPYVAKVQEVLSVFFRRQGRSVRSALGAKADEDWWEEERWDEELKQDLFPLGVMVSSQAAGDTLDRLGFAPSEYDVERTLGYLTMVAATTAHNMNQVTKAQIAEALAGEEPLDAVRHIFEVAETSRSELAGAVLAGSFAAWGSMEAGRQLAGGAAVKTWITGPNPRPEHAFMDGETVPVNQPFSNGSMWPADGQDGEYGCNCSLEISIP